MPDTDSTDAKIKDLDQRVKVIEHWIECSRPHPTVERGPHNMRPVERLTR